MSTDICSPAVGPYGGVEIDVQFEIAGHALRALTYRSYNACGLIGSEYNGIAILSEDDLQVVCDNIDRALSGYSLDLRGLKERIKEIRDMSYPRFVQFLKNEGADRTRYIPERKD